MDLMHDIHGLVKLEEYDAVKKTSEMLAIGGKLQATADDSPSEGDEDGGDYISRLRS
jgi:hypothetical protein